MRHLRALLALTACLIAPRPAVAQGGTCFFVSGSGSTGVRFISTVQCINGGSVDVADVSRAITYYRRNNYTAEQNRALGNTRSVVRQFDSRNEAEAARNRALALADGTAWGTPGWSYSPGVAQLAAGLDAMSNVLDPILIENGIGFSMGTSFGTEWSLTYGATVRFGGRWRIHAFKPIASLSLGRQGPDDVPNGEPWSEFSGWGADVMMNLTRRIAVGIGAHSVTELVQAQDMSLETFEVSNKHSWDPTVTLILPLGYLPLYARYGQKSQFGIGMIVEFGR